MRRLDAGFTSRLKLEDNVRIFERYKERCRIKR